MSQLPECDYCERTDSLKRMDDSLVCPDCETKGIHAANERQKQAGKAMDAINGPIDINEVLRNSRTIDQSIQVRTDLFNAATVAIMDIKKAIDEDVAIENKPYALASELMNRLNHHKQVIFELNEKMVDAQNNQRAIQQYMNQLANQLRAEEREKLKIQDINYKPGPVRTVTPKQIKLAKPRLDKKELRKYAAELGVAEFTLQMLVVSKGLSVEAAANLLRTSLNAAKSAATTEKTNVTSETDTTQS
jgi:uncharacterized coiled-coil protein SlyX